MVTGYIIAYCFGLACIVLPRQGIKLFDAILQHALDRQVERMKTPVAEEDRVIRPVFSVVFGVLIIFLTFVAQQRIPV